MTFTAEHYATLRRLGLEWSFRSSALTSDGISTFCDLTDRSSRLTVLTAEGADHSDALVKAVELAVHRDNEIKRAATERAALTVENDKLIRQIATAQGN